MNILNSVKVLFQIHEHLDICTENKKSNVYYKYSIMVQVTQSRHHVATGQLNCNKRQITAFHKMLNTRAENLRTDYSNKNQ